MMYITILCNEFKLVGVNKYCLVLKRTIPKYLLQKNTELSSQTDSLIPDLSVNFSKSITQWQTVFNDNSFHITWWPRTCPFWLAKRQKKKLQETFIITTQGGTKEYDSSEENNHLFLHSER